MPQYPAHPRPDPLPSAIAAAAELRANHPNVIAPFVGTGWVPLLLATIRELDELIPDQTWLVKEKFGELTIQFCLQPKPPHEVWLRVNEIAEQAHAVLWSRFLDCQGTGIESAENGVRNASLWRALLGVEKTVVEEVEFDEDGGVLVVHVRPTRSAASRCGRCQRRAPGYDPGQGRRR